MPANKKMTAERPPQLSREILRPKSQFIEMLENRWVKDQFVCVGLDTEFTKIPEECKRGLEKKEAIFNYNKRVIDATFDIVGSYKPNIAFYEEHGEEGIVALKKTIRYIKDRNPSIPVILDAKRGDIGNTNSGYVNLAFEELGADAITVHPYLGKEALEPFLEKRDKGVIILARTSNSGAGEFQDLIIDGEPLYLRVAKSVAESWNQNGNCALVVGATYPKELADVRSAVGDMPILIPGIGAQGGDLEAAVKAGKDSRGWGMIINSSRGIIFAKRSDGESIEDAARRESLKLNNGIKEFRTS